MAQLLAPDVTAPATIDTEETSDAAAHAPLPLVALVLGASGVILGVTVIWFFAAIPVGIVSVATGVIAARRVETYHDPRAASRATIGTALGCVAILLGITGAFFLPRIMDRGDRFLGTVEKNVNGDVNSVNRGLTRDVDRLDRTLTRDLRRFENQNRTDLRDLENRTAATMAALEKRLNGDVDHASVQARADLIELEAALRADLRAARKEASDASTALHDLVAALDARVTRIEHELGM